ncbi:hypothetical protein B0H19DRAFT_1113211 [Mycena capillaripes]|nr:hypothetical protein B0H19DRAFT_1113211 [Mycena capillaripes]
MGHRRVWASGFSIKSDSPVNDLWSPVPRAPRTRCFLPRKFVGWDDFGTKLWSGLSIQQPRERLVSFLFLPVDEKAVVL